MFGRFLRRLCVVAVLFVGVSAARAENWPGWRGPRGDGTSLETDVPLRWGPETNILWKTPLPYEGHASAIVFDDRVYVVGVDDPDGSPKRPGPEAHDRVLIALDRRSGKVLWTQTVLRAPLERIHHLNSRASSTPAADEHRVYVSFLDGQQMFIAAYDHQGRKVWTTHPGVFSSVHGYCSSPVLFENMVIVNGDHDGQAYLVALDRKTGKTIWKTPRENHRRSYCTPIIRTIGGRTQMMLSGSKCIASYDPRDGTRQWIIDGPTEQFVASLIENEGLLFVTGGFPDKHILAIDPTGEGNVTDTHIKWRHERTGVSYVPSPVAAGRCFYVVSDGGIGTCYDAPTGKVLWRERMGRHYSGSLVAAAGRVYFQDDDGHTKVVAVGPKFRILAENDLGERVYSSTAISHGCLFVRGESHLFCIGETSSTSAPDHEADD